MVSFFIPFGFTVSYGLIPLKYSGNESVVLKSQSRQKAVTIGITALFAVNVGELVMNWYFTDLCFVRATDSRLDIFNKNVSDGLFSVLDDILQGIGQIIADTLLVSIILRTRDFNDMINM